MEIPSLRRRLDISGSDDPVTEMLTLVPLRGVPLDHGTHDLEDLLLLDAAAVQLVQPLAVVATTEVHIVGIVGLANERDLGQPRTGTAVGATGHAHDNAVL